MKKSSGKQSRKSAESNFNKYTNTSTFFVCLLGIVISMPIMLTPLGTDDIWMSTLRAHNDYNNLSWWDYLLFKSEEFHNIGRLSQITNLIQWTTSFFITDRYFYKLFLIILNFLVAFLIRKMILDLVSKSFIYYANLAFVFFIALGQIRNYYDPRTSITGIAQFTSIAMMLAIGYAIKYYAKPNNRNIFLFSFFSVLSFYIYEMSFFILFPVFLYFFYVVLIKNYKVEKKIKNAAIISSLAILMQYAIFLWTHYSAPSLQDDSTINFSWEKIVRTFLLQFFGSFPAKKFGTQKVYEPDLVSDTVIWVTILLICVLIALFTRSFRNCVRSKYSSKSNVVNQFALNIFSLFAIAMIVIPTALTAVTLRFQEDVQAGLPYAGFYFLQIGICLLVSSFLFVLTNRILEIRLTLVMAFFVVYFAFLSVITNYTVVNPGFPLNDNASLSQPVLGWGRETVEDFARSGFFNSPEKNFYFYPQYSWTATEYLSFISGHQVSILNSPSWWNNTSIFPDLECGVEDRCSKDHYVEVKGFSYSSGFLKISRMKDLSITGGQALSRNWELVFIGDFRSSLRLERCKSILSSKDISVVQTTQDAGLKNYSVFEVSSKIPIQSNELNLCFK
jgi:hypothetical protein